MADNSLWLIIDTSEDSTYSSIPIYAVNGAQASSRVHNWQRFISLVLFKGLADSGSPSKQIITLVCVLSSVHGCCHITLHDGA